MSVVQNSSEMPTWTILHGYPDAAIDASWREFLTRADFPAHYVSPEYFREPFLRDKESFVVLAWQGDKIVGAISGIREDRELICGLMSRPQICFDQSCDRERAAEALVNGLLDEAKSAKLITLFSWVPLDTLSQH